MRVLILSAILVSATAAPSTLLAPVKAVPIIPAAVPLLPAALPTIDPGDIQAAAINAKVIADDQAQAAVDQARSLAEQAVETTNEKVVENIEQAKETNENSFWSAEDKKWQALDAVKTAEAKIDGAVASNSPALAKSAIGGLAVQSYIAPFPAPIAQIAPFSAPIVANFPAPILYSAPGFIANPELVNSAIIANPELIKSAIIANQELIKSADEKKDEGKKEEIQLKAAEIEETKKETDKAEGLEVVKSAEPEKGATVEQLAAIGPVFVAPALRPTLLAAPPVYSYIPTYPAAYNAVQQVQTPILTPLVKNW